MVVLVLRAVEGNWIGVLDSHCKSWLTSGLASRADQEAGVEGAIRLACSSIASSSRSNGMVLRWSARIDHAADWGAYSGDPNELDRITSVGCNGRGVEDSQAICANLDLMCRSIGGRDANQSGNSRLGEMHGEESNVYNRIDRRMGETEDELQESIGKNANQ